jgi:CheY-like chemotaxis protein/HPt (histidine-containing phosphotransfer) domain-containing protein
LRQAGRILVVEDNPANQQVALAVLEKFGCRADAVANGKEAVEILRQVPYDLVLMDCQMPEMNGYEASAMIRDSNSGVCHPDVPIVALTAHAMTGDRERCLAAGMNDYIAKPIEPATLRAALDKWLPRGPRARNGGVPKTAQPDDRPSDRPQVFDQEALMNRLMGDRQLATSILQRFLEDIPAQLATLRARLDVGDISSAEGLAHKIKGAAASVSGLALYHAARTVEQLGRAGDLDAMRTKSLELEREYQAAREAMSASLSH